MCNVIRTDTEKRVPEFEEISPTACFPKNAARRPETGIPANVRLRRTPPGLPRDATPIFRGRYSFDLRGTSELRRLLQTKLADVIILSDETRGDVGLAFQELVTNVVKHAGNDTEVGEQKKSVVQVAAGYRCRSGRFVLYLRIADRGKGFDARLGCLEGYSGMGEVTGCEYKDGSLGKGFTLVASLMDRVSVHSSRGDDGKPSGTTIVIAKCIRLQPPTV